MRHYIKDEPENKTHPAVALILQHLRSEARTFDVVGPAGQKEILCGDRERWKDDRTSISHSTKVNASYSGADQTILSPCNHVKTSTILWHHVTDKVVSENADWPDLGQ